MREEASLWNISWACPLKFMWIGIDGRVLQEETFGGVREYAKNILCSLLRLDTKNQYVIFTNKWMGQKGLELPLTSNAHFVSFRYPNKLLNLSLWLLGAPALDSLVEKEIWRQTGQKIKLDIFWAPNLNFIRLSAETKFFLTVHDLSFFVEPSFFSSKERFWHALVSPQKIFRQADVLLPVSSYTAGELARLGFSAPKREIVWPGISRKFFETSEEEVDETRRAHGLPPKYILFLAAKGKRKNFEGVIKAFQMARLPVDLHLVIAGEGTDGRREGRIIGLGAVPEKARRALYKGAEFFVYPSFYEGFGLPVLEAMSSGTPVITSSVTSLSEVASDAAILVDPHNVGELRAAMETLSSSAALRDKFIAKGIIQAANFTWNTSGRHLLEQFEKIK